MNLREAFRGAAGGFAGVVERIGVEQWERPGLGEWTVRELAAHTLRALTTVEQYLDADAEVDGYDLDLPERYYARILHGGDGSIHRAVLERGRAAGADLNDPATTIPAVIDRVLALVEATEGAAVVRTPVGTMRLDHYLPTRIVELVIHTLDLARATNVAAELDPAALAVALGVLVRVQPGVLERTLMALTGREQLPPDFNVLGPN